MTREKTTVQLDDPLLTVPQVAELLGTSAGMPRRLIAERRIRFVRVGRYVRVPRSAVAEYLASEMVLPRERPAGRAGVRGRGRVA